MLSPSRTLACSTFTAIERCVPEIWIGMQDEVLFEQPTNLRAATPVEPAAKTLVQVLEDDV